MINKRALQDELTDAFINYQWNLENPMPNKYHDKDALLHHYLCDRLFHNKVDNIVSGIMLVIIPHLDKGDV